MGIRENIRKTAEKELEQKTEVAVRLANAQKQYEQGLITKKQLEKIKTVSMMSKEKSVSEG